MGQSVGMWYEPGSKRVRTGYVAWDILHGELHHSVLCESAWADDLQQADVIEYRTGGQYMIHPRSGQRRKPPKECRRCAPNKIVYDIPPCTTLGCGRNSVSRGLCPEHRGQLAAPDLRRLALAWEDECVIEDCNGAASKADLCKPHYRYVLASRRNDDGTLRDVA